MAEDTSGAHPKSILNDSDKVFDVGAAYNSGETAGTIVSDRKRKGVLGQLKSAATELAGSATKAVKDVKLFEEEPPKPAVTPGEERKDIISKAVQSNQQAPKDDHDVVIERIRTFQKDAERVSGKPYLIQKNKEQPKSAWTHTVTEPEEKKEAPAKPAPQITESIRRTPAPEMPSHMTGDVIPTRKSKPQPAPEPSPVTVQEPIPTQEPEPAAPEPMPEPAPAPRVRTEAPNVPTPPQEPSKLPRILGMVGIGIIVAAVVVGGGMYIYTLFTSGTTQTENTPDTPLSLDLEATLPVDQLTTLPLRIEEQETTISQVVIVENGTPLSTAAFFAAVTESAPGTLVRALESGMATGGVRSGSDVQPYLLFRANSFDNAFAGMLAWEGNIGADLQELFTRASGGTFVDRVIGNQHVRILYDASGTERLVYGFVNGRTLIITTSSTAFRTILGVL